MSYQRDAEELLSAKRAGGEPGARGSQQLQAEGGFSFGEDDDNCEDAHAQGIDRYREAKRSAPGYYTNRAAWLAELGLA